MTNLRGHGLVLSYRNRMAYGRDFGFGKRLPVRLKIAICWTWNRVACLFLKHELVVTDLGEHNTQCVYCRARIHVLVSIT